MTSDIYRSFVRFKRCPQCGDVVLITSPICPCCDRHFQTVAFLKAYPQSYGATLFATASPYGYAGAAVDPSDFYINGSKTTKRSADTEVRVMPIVLAVIDLAWLGMILNKQVGKGILTSAAWICWLVGLFLYGHTQVGFLVTTLVGIGGYIVGLADVICIAARRSRAEPVGDWDWF